MNYTVQDSPTVSEATSYFPWRNFPKTPLSILMLQTKSDCTIDSKDAILYISLIIFMDFRIMRFKSFFSSMTVLFFRKLVSNRIYTQLSLESKTEYKGNGCSSIHTELGISLDLDRVPWQARSLIVLIKTARISRHSSVLMGLVHITNKAGFCPWTDS